MKKASRHYLVKERSLDERNGRSHNGSTENRTKLSGKRFNTNKRWKRANIVAKESRAQKEAADYCSICNMHIPATHLAEVEPTS